MVREPYDLRPQEADCPDSKELYFLGHDAIWRRDYPRTSG